MNNNRSSGTNEADQAPTPQRIKTDEIDKVNDKLKLVHALFNSQLKRVTALDNQARTQPALTDLTVQARQHVLDGESTYLNKTAVTLCGFKGSLAKMLSTAEVETEGGDRVRRTQAESTARVGLCKTFSFDEIKSQLEEIVTRVKEREKVLKEFEARAGKLGKASDDQGQAAATK